MMKFKSVLTLIIFILSQYAFSSGTTAFGVNIPSGLIGDQHQFDCAGNILNNEKPDIIFIGENHFDGRSQEFVAQFLDNLKEEGFEFFFAEYIESQDQDYIDQFYDNPKENINKLYSTFALPGDWGYDPSKYLELSLNVISSGIQLMGLDRRRDLNYMVDRDQKMSIRDQHMFEVAESYVDGYPGKKMVFFNGWSHSFENKSLATPSFYERFTKRFPGLKVINLKRDFYEEMSSQRLNISRSERKLKDRCEGDFVFLKGDNRFDYYVFEEERDLLPISDSLMNDII